MLYKSNFQNPFNPLNQLIKTGLKTPFFNIFILQSHCERFSMKPSLIKAKRLSR